MNLPKIYPGPTISELITDHMEKCPNYEELTDEEEVVARRVMEDLADDVKKKIANEMEGNLAIILGDLYLEMKAHFVDYEKQTHKLGRYKERVKDVFEKMKNDYLFGA